MNDHAYPRAQTFYPQVANHIDNDPTPKDQAVYVPSVTPDYAIAAFEQQWKRPLPNGVHSGAFNFLDPANRDFFHISHVMSSAGQALNQSRDCIITKRDRGATTLICDSGGYQIASQRGCIDAYRDRGKILGWMELHADYAMTLDVPTGPVLKQGYPYKTTQDCLKETINRGDKVYH